MTGKSITGALLFGYMGVEIGKSIFKYKNPTGDLFAIVVPLGIMFGRVGCFFHGCCQGREFDLLGLTRWPASMTEFLFNFFALIVALCLSKFKILPNQHFNLYLIFYGVFRFFHEFLRDTPKVFFEFSGYQFVSLLLVIVGIVGFVIRKGRMKEMK
jgi:phosphatidylglycerol:prolipoprotein diacylglycerol transferase